MAQAIDARLRGVVPGLAIASFTGTAPATGAAQADFSLEPGARSRQRTQQRSRRFHRRFDMLRPNGRWIARESRFANLPALAEFEWLRGRAAAWLCNAEAGLHQSHRVPAFNRRKLALQAGTTAHGGSALERNRWHFEDLSLREVRLGLGLDPHPRDAVEISLRATRRHFGAPRRARTIAASTTVPTCRSVPR